MILRKIARPLLGTAFIASGIDAVRSPSGPASVAEPLLQSTEVEPQTVIQAAGVVQIGAGIALATGRAPRLASAVLVGTLVPTTLFASDFWNESDPARRSIKQSAFVKNIGLLGGALIASADTEGKPSLGWRGRRRLEQADEAINTFRTRHEGDAASKWDEWSGKASTAVSDIAAQVPVDDITRTVTNLADGARSRIADAAHAAPGVVEDVRHRAEQAAQGIADNAPEVAAEARTLAAAAGEKTARRVRRWRRELVG
ncbi:DoxX family protein [Gordonia phthalatica]|uniref:DoxX family protein n=1 Tax=Gordonia phthalatica TaxID=1136941 RepID=UPI0009E7A313|nr:DoxX family protein [Gordonia phthalatica]